MKRTPETIGAAERQEAARALDGIAKSQQRAAMSNMQRVVHLKADDPLFHKKALDGLRQAIGHRVPGWEAMLSVVAMLTGEDAEAARQRVGSSFAAKEREQIAREARRGMIAGDWHEELLLQRLRTLPEQTQEMVFSYVSQRATAEAVEAVTGTASESRQPFAVITGGRADA